MLLERSSSPTDTEICYKDPGRLLEDGEPSSQQNPVVTNLASAILQVAQSVKRKYLQKPLGKFIITSKLEISIWLAFCKESEVLKC
jgi:hypothetical protein